MPDIELEEGAVYKSVERSWPMTSNDIVFHPLATIFPLLEGNAFEELTRDIAEHGLREPIVLHEGAILDGRNRYRACLVANVEAHFETFGGLLCQR